MKSKILIKCSECCYFPSLEENFQNKLFTCQLGQAQWQCKVCRKINKEEIYNPNLQVATQAIELLSLKTAQEYHRRKQNQLPFPSNTCNISIVLSIDSLLDTSILWVQPLHYASIQTQLNSQNKCLAHLPNSSQIVQLYRGIKASILAIQRADNFTFSWDSFLGNRQITTLEFNLYKLEQSIQQASKKVNLNQNQHYFKDQILVWTSHEKYVVQVCTNREIIQILVKIILISEFGKSNWLTKHFGLEVQDYLIEAKHGAGLAKKVSLFNFSSKIRGSSELEQQISSYLTFEVSPPERRSWTIQSCHSKDPDCLKHIFSHNISLLQNETLPEHKFHSSFVLFYTHSHKLNSLKFENCKLTLQIQQIVQNSKSLVEDLEQILSKVLEMAGKEGNVQKMYGEMEMENKENICVFWIGRWQLVRKKLFEELPNSNDRMEDEVEE